MCGKAVTLQPNHREVQIDQEYCIKYVKPINAIAKGESKIGSDYHRNATISLFDLDFKRNCEWLYGHDKGFFSMLCAPTQIVLMVSSHGLLKLKPVCELRSIGSRITKNITFAAVASRTWIFTRSTAAEFLQVCVVPGQILRRSVWVLFVFVHSLQLWRIFILDAHGAASPYLSFVDLRPFYHLLLFEYILFCVFRWLSDCQPTKSIKITEFGYFYIKCAGDYLFAYNG